MVHTGWQNLSMNVRAQILIMVLIGRKLQFSIFTVRKLNMENQKAFSGQSIALLSVAGVG